MVCSLTCIVDENIHFMSSLFDFIVQCLSSPRFAQICGKDIGLDVVVCFDLSLERFEGSLATINEYDINAFLGMVNRKLLSNPSAGFCDECE